MYEVVNDPINVTADFRENRVRPLSMTWSGHDYTIEQVHLVHTARQGNKKLFFFSVSDSSTYFKLQLDPEFLEWRLVEFADR